MLSFYLMAFVFIGGLCEGRMGKHIRRDGGHKITVVNNCGKGTPMIKSTTMPLQNVPTGGYYSAAPLPGWIVFLQTGECSEDGNGCVTVEGALFLAGEAVFDPEVGTLDGNGGFVDISLIGEHKLNVDRVSFAFADAPGRTCSHAKCDCNQDAYCVPLDNGAIAGSSSPSSSVAITFC